MKRSLVVKLFLVTTLITSCHQSEKYENASKFSFQDFKTTTKLNAVTIDFDEPIMLPWLFIKSDSLLIVHNIRTNNLLYVYNVNSRKKVGEFISWGNGPNDLLRIKNMQLVDSDLYISDSQKRTIFKYDINDFHKSTDDIIPIEKVAVDDFFSNLIYTDNGYVATTVNPNNKRLVFFNSKGEKEFTAGEYPYYGKELTAIEKMEGFLSVIAISPKHQRIFLFGLSTDLIEIYDFQGVLIKKLHGPKQVFPQVKEVREGNVYRISAVGSIFTFSSPLIVDDEIYVSYSGHQHERNKDAPERNHILVFDMDCNPVRNYELSKPIVSFTVDPETKQIYATSNVPEYHMVVFE